MVATSVKIPVNDYNRQRCLTHREEEAAAASAIEAEVHHVDVEVIAVALATEAEVDQEVRICANNGLEEYCALT